MKISSKLSPSPFVPRFKNFRPCICIFSYSPKFHQIHVDRYKYSIYTHISDRLLRTLVTNDPSTTRFHACERFCRCEYVAVENGTSRDKDGKYSSLTKDGRTVVYVNPVTMSEESWNLYLVDMGARLGRGEIITNLVWLGFAPSF
jgi:DNA cross-link repair 1C protein